MEVELPSNMRELPPEVAPCKEFAGLNCGRVLGRNLKFAGFAVPTPVQGHSVPMAIGCLDVISVAQTGSGKTLAFMLPILYKLLQAGPGGGNYGGGRNTVVAIRACVMAPTRELAQQIQVQTLCDGHSTPRPSLSSWAVSYPLPPTPEPSSTPSPHGICRVHVCACQARWPLSHAAQKEACMQYPSSTLHPCLRTLGGETSALHSPHTLPPGLSPSL
mgnify:CR=1 FL=1